MPDGEGITLGELSRELSKMENRIDARLAAFERRLDTLQYVSREAYTLQVGALIDRVESLEDSKRWFARTLAAAFFVAFMAPVLVALVVSQ